MHLPVPSLHGTFPRRLFRAGMTMAVLPAMLAGCTSLHNPLVRSDLYETQVRAAGALGGNAPAFERLGQLQKRWERRAADNWCHRLMPWDRANRVRSATVVADIQRVSGARDAVTSQRELGQVMVNALRNIEDEYDAINENLQQQGGGEQGGYGEDGVAAEEGGQGGGLPPANLRALADQKYLARRMAGSLALMSSPDMSQAIEASDQFGRDANRFRKLLDATINGDEALGIKAADNPDLQDSLSQIDELFAGYIGDSAPDLLDNVVMRYDAWTALGELNALTPVAVAKTKAAAAPAAKPAAAPPAEAAAPAVDEQAATAEEGSAADAGAGGDPGAQDNGAPDNPADEGDVPANDAEDAGSPI